MKNLITIACILFSLPLMAQTKVVKKNAVKANNFGITYSLPKTQLIVDAEVTKVTCKAGPYYKYAEKYLGVKDAVTEDKVYYEKYPWSIKEYPIRTIRISLNLRVEQSLLTLI